ncbi:MAG: hypothetical protein EA399_11530 [Desulfovibrionales bacterium]|nr:MAG: hypothetical protein EA399_11530 [Desulfovibrionales bacterium]
MNVSRTRKCGQRPARRRIIVTQDGTTTLWSQYKDRHTAREKLVIAAMKLAKSKRSALDKMKDSVAQLERPDFLWHYLLQSFATMGRAAGWHGLIGNRTNYTALRYNVLDNLSGIARRQQVETVCRAAGIRMPDLKAKYIIGCFDAVRTMGGPEAAKTQLLARKGRDAKIRFLKSLPGIGDKYARNIMMDVYHEDFRDCIAVDARIKSISRMLGLAFVGYEDQEAYYLDVARAAGLNGWELDRLIFNYLDAFKQALRSL